MQLWTIQMGKWRLAKAQDIHLLDTTVKSGIPAFAPSWEMVQGIKSGTLSQEAYAQQYYARMRQGFLSYRSDWEALASHERLALACYCAPGEFCHRLLLADMVQSYFESRSIVVQRCGELLA